jgi:hypothetical protein
MWIKWVEWRLDYQPHKIRSRDVRGTSLNKCFFKWVDNNNGNPSIVICPGATDEIYDAETTFRLAAYVMEKVCRRADKNGTTQI